MITYIPAHYGIAADRDKDASASTQHGLMLDRNRRGAEMWCVLYGGAMKIATEPPHGPVMAPRLA